MKILIDISERDYELIRYNIQATSTFENAYYAIRNGTVIPKGAEILTAEAYSDLCLRASEQKVGKWIRGGFWSDGCGMGETYGYYYKCSECGAEVKNDYKKCGYNFCPNCGARMVTDDE